MEQAISVAGALMILAAYAGNQLGRLDRTHLAYGLLNLIGSLILAVVAWRDRQFGFLLLETAWVAVSLPCVLRALRRRQ